MHGIGFTKKDKTKDQTLRKYALHQAGLDKKPNQEELAAKKFAQRHHGDGLTNHERHLKNRKLHRK